jgi:hypothetical protein
VSGRTARPVSLVSDGSNLYWGDDSKFVRCSLSGSCLFPETIASNVSLVESAIEGGFLYWYWKRCAVGGCNDQPSTITTDNFLNSNGLAVDATNIYWANNSIDKIRRCPVSGCSEPIDVTTSIANTIVVKGTSLYWITYDGGVYSCPTTGCPEPFEYHPRGSTAVGYHIKRGLFVDDAEVLWTSEDGGVYGCALGGCGGNPRVLARSQARPGRMVADANYVYWINYDNGAVLKVAR